MTLLKAENISCGYGSGDIVSGVSLELKSGEILSVAGKNGCGKTTLLRCLCGIIKPSSGHIEIEDEDISPLMGKNRRELAQKIALFSQTSAGGAFGSYTVFDTVMMGRYPYMTGAFASPGAEDVRTVKECMEKTKISDLSSRYIGELSGGQLQRVFLAKTFAQQPKIILLDEPANHIDLSGQPELIALMRDWTASGGAAVTVFHDLSLCAAASDRMMLMDGGKKIAEGSCRDICRSDKISQIYGFDVPSYMKKMLSFWSE